MRKMFVAACALALAACSDSPVPKAAIADGESLCAPAGGLAYVRVTGTYVDGSTRYQAICVRENTSVDFRREGILQ